MLLTTFNTESGFKDASFITASYGLGENIVQGAVNPDEYYVFKPTLKQGYRPIVQKKLGTKELKMIYAENKGGEATTTIPTPIEDQRKFCLTDDEVLQLGFVCFQFWKHWKS